MNIDRHNYEEFFILYMDNELSSEDRRQVELFVQAHPDLKEELEMLQQVQFSPDDSVSFDHKESLVRYADCDITIHNYDEWLVLYIDNELTEKQKTIVESFVASYPAAQAELELLKKTKLQPGEVTFPGKESLYRKEETKRRVITMRWWRIAAAAVLFIAIATASFLLTNNNIPGTIDKPTAHDGTIDNRPAYNSSQDRSTNSADQSGTEQSAMSEATQPGNTEAKNSELAAQSTQKSNSNNRPIQKINTLEKINQDQPGTQHVIASTSVDNNINNLPDPTKDPNMGRLQTMTSFDPNTASTAALTNIKATEPTLAVTYTTPQPYNSTEGNNEVAQPEKKNKLRGIFRTIARTIEKKTNIKATDEKDRLLIGGLAIQL